MKYYNTFLICIGLLFSSCWWEEPNEASPLDTFTSQINFVVTPDTSEIKVNDTIWFSYNASNTFTAPTGKLKTVSNVNTTMPIRVYRINSGGPWVRSDKLDCEYLFIEGSYSLIPGTNSISYISSVYFNSKYRLKMGFIPQIADTFFIEINPSVDQRKGEAFVINASFFGTRQNLELITPHGYWDQSASKRSSLYAFIAR